MEITNFLKTIIVIIVHLINCSSNFEHHLRIKSTNQEILVDDLSQDEIEMNNMEGLNPFADQFGSGNRKKRNTPYFPRCLKASIKGRALNCREPLSSIGALSFSNSSICFRDLSCPSGNILTQNCFNCMTSNKTTSIKILDDVQCQKTQKTNFGFSSIESPDWLCSFVDINLRRCSNSALRIMWLEWALVGDSLMILESAHYTYSQQLKSIDNYECTSVDSESLCDGTTCARGECLGDNSYTVNFAAVGTNQLCHCKLAPNRGIMKIRVGNSELMPTCWGKSHTIVHRLTQSIRKSDMPCPLCKVICSGTHVTVEGLPLIPKMVTICKTPECFSKAVDSLSFTAALQPEMALNAGVVRLIIFYPKEVATSNLETECPAGDHCEIIDCIFCLAMLSNPTCWNTLLWIIMTASTFILLSLVLSVFSLLCHCCRLIVLILWLFKRIVQPVYNKIKRRKIGYSKVKTDDEEFNDLQILTKSHKTGKTGKPIRVAGQIIGFAIVMSMQVIEGCILSNSITIEAPQCTYGINGVEDCRATFTSFLSIAPIGQVSCFLLKDPQNKNLGNIALKTDSIDLICMEEELYYAPLVSAEKRSKFNCDGADKCTTSYCQDEFSPTTMLSEWSSISANLGVSGCAWTGSSGQSCFYSQGCLFHRLYLQPKAGTPKKVVRCSNWIYEVKVMASLTTLMNSTSEVIKLRAGVTTAFSTIRFELQSVSLPVVPKLSDCFLMEPIGVAMSPCREPGFPKSGSVGEIQCQSYNEALEASKTCKWSDDLLKLDATPSGGVLKSNLINLDQIFLQNLLPKRVGDVLFTYEPSSKQIRAQFKVTSQFQVTLQSTETRLIAKGDMSKCHTTFVNISGCCHCSAGAVLVLKGRTDFGMAQAVLTCDKDNVLSTFVLKSVESDVKIVIALSEPNVNMHCTVTCPGSTETFTAIGSLTTIILDSFIKNDQIGVMNTEISNITLLSFKGLLAFIPNWFPFDWLFYPFLFLFVVIFLVLTYFKLQQVLFKKVVRTFI